MAATDERYTPPEVWEPLRRIFGFNLDPCTSPENPLAVRYFYTEEDDGLCRAWGAVDRARAFVNPPYSDMVAWARKAIMEARAGCFVAFILPNDCSTEAWKLLKAASWGQWDVPFRVKFLSPEGKRLDVARGHVVFFLGGLK